MAGQYFQTLMPQVYIYGRIVLIWYSCEEAQPVKADFVVKAKMFPQWSAFPFLLCL